jgi:hypothetical protein
MTTNASTATCPKCPGIASQQLATILPFHLALYNLAKQVLMVAGADGDKVRSRP